MCMEALIDFCYGKGECGLEFQRFSAEPCGDSQEPGDEPRSVPSFIIITFFFVALKLK